MADDKPIQVSLKHEPFGDCLNTLDQGVKLIAMRVLTQEIDGTPLEVFLKRYDVAEIRSFPQPKGASLVQFKLAELPQGMLKCVALLSGTTLIPVVCELVN